jgi:hypothetical protein
MVECWYRCSMCLHDYTALHPIACRLEILDPNLGLDYQIRSSSCYQQRTEVEQHAWE